MARIPADRPVRELRNIGPVCEQELRSAGILTAGDIRDLGVKETFLRLMAARERSGKSTGCYNAAYLYALYGAVHDIDWREIPEKKRNEFRKFTAELRADIA